MDKAVEQYKDRTELLFSISNSLHSSSLSTFYYFSGLAGPEGGGGGTQQHSTSVAEPFLPSIIRIMRDLL